MTIAKQLRALRAKSGLSKAQWAKILGMEPNTYGYYETRYKRNFLPPELYDQLHTAQQRLGLTDEDLEPLRPDVSAPPVAVIPAGATNPKTLPILGAARGGPDGQGFIDNGAHFGYASRPQALMNVDEAYAVYMVGDSMEPRYFAGEILSVNPRKPVSRGCFVVVQTADERGDRSYLVKRYLSRSNDVLRLEEFAPERRQFELDAASVVAVHRIVALEEA